MEKVVLVDQHDNAVGAMEKMEAHRRGVLHRAFSIFLFNTAGEMLLQQRALDKYHSAGLWTNACCSHPRPGEQVAAAAARRLREELGIATPLEPVFQFVYQAAFENGLQEHEYDHVLAGLYDGDIPFNPLEVQAVRYVTMQALRRELQDNPTGFTAWFRLAFPKIEQWWPGQYPAQPDKAVTLL